MLELSQGIRTEILSNIWWDIYRPQAMQSLFKIMVFPTLLLYGFGTLVSRVSQRKKLNHTSLSQRNRILFWDLFECRSAATAFLFSGGWRTVLWHEPCFVCKLSTDIAESMGRVHHQCSYWWWIFLPHPDLTVIPYHIHTWPYSSQNVLSWKAPTSPTPIVNVRLIMSQ